MRTNKPKVFKPAISVVLILSLVGVLLLLAAIIPYIAKRVRFNQTSIKIKKSVLSKQSEGSKKLLAIFSLSAMKIQTANTDAHDKKVKSGVLKIKIALGYNKKNTDLKTELETKHFEIRTRIYDIISEKTLSVLDEISEREYLKQHIQREVNKLLNNGKIEAVFFEEFAILVEK